MNVKEETPLRTLLRLPSDLRERLEASAVGDRRTVPQQVVVLIEEALDARKRGK